MKEIQMERMIVRVLVNIYIWCHSGLILLILLAIFNMLHVLLNIRYQLNDLIARSKLQDKWKMLMFIETAAKFGNTFLGGKGMVKSSVLFCDMTLGETRERKM